MTPAPPPDASCSLEDATPRLVRVLEWLRSAQEIRGPFAMLLEPRTGRMVQACGAPPRPLRVDLPLVRLDELARVRARSVLARAYVLRCSDNTALPIAYTDEPDPAAAAALMVRVMREVHLLPRVALVRVSADYSIPPLN